MKTITYDPAQVKFLPNLPRHEPFVMDSTAYKVLVECRRKYFYKIVLGRIPFANKFQNILDFGTHYHKFRELLETHGYSEAMNYILGAKITPVEPGSKFAFLDSLRLVKTCQAAYEHWKVEKSQNKIEVIAVEQPFNVEVAPDHFIGGRADQIVRWMGRLWGRDFKTTTKDKATFTRQIDPNDQAMRYIVGESAIHGNEVQGIIFEAAYNAKTVGPVIYSLQSTRNKYQKDNWLKEVEINSRQLKMYREEDIWPMDTSGKCDWCEYHKVCKLGSPQSMEAVLKSDYKFQVWDHTKVEQGE